MSATARPAGRLPRIVVGIACLLLLIVGLTRGAPAGSGETPLAQAIAARSSQPFSLFVHAGGELWYQPLAVYPAAVLLGAGVSRDLALRLPAILAGILTMVLTYALAKRVTARQEHAALAAVLLLLMPGFLDASRAVGADLLMVPLVMAWMLAVLGHVDARTDGVRAGHRPRPWALGAGGAALGLGAYTQPAGVLAVPVFFVLGAAMLCRPRRDTAALAFGAIGVIAVLLPAGVWLVQHRDAYPDTFGRWAILAPHIRVPWDGVVAFTRWHVMARRVGEYWHYLSPTFLFGTTMLGLPFGLLLPLGLWRIGAAFPRAGRTIAAGGFFAAPIAGVLLDVPRSAAYALLYLPLAALIAIPAVDAIARHRWRVVVAVALAVCVGLTLAAK